MQKKLILCFIYILSCLTVLTGQNSSLIKGLSFVAPRSPFDSNPFIHVKNVYSDWIAVIPYAFCKTNEPKVHFNHDDTTKRWWGESRRGVESTIREAQKNELKIMLKPQVWYGRDWIGNLSFKTTAEWEAWEKSYEEYILPFADLAEKECVEILCIGTEIKQSIIQRPLFWQRLITKIRSRYHGLITYAANWDEYQYITFWNKMDYIGIDAYFPLTESHTPAPHDLMKPWEEVLSKLEKFHKKFKRPILFTEYGYLSVDGAAGKTWELESKLSSLNYNQQAQANCIQALLECCKKKSFWAGGFLWKWYPDIHKSKRGMEKDHTPQGKLAEEILRLCYSQM